MSRETRDGENATHTVDPLASIRAGYVELLGSVPPAIETRLSLGERSGRERAVGLIEALRDELIMANPLGRKVGQLVHFAQLLVRGEAGPARLHVRGARRAGASVEELVGVAELALITAGMPAYSLGVEIIGELIDEEDANGEREKSSDD